MSLKENIIPKLKKYLFFISIIFFIASFSHIFYVYIYSNARTSPLAWWTISEWIIWDFPHLNPLIPSSDYNKYIINILYRSLLKYDYKENKFVPDLASCDIKNLAYIECYLNDNIKWSDGTPLNIDDVKATYDSILSTEVNPIISSLLKDTKIETKDNIIIFSNTRNDINFLNVLLQPIVSQKILNTIGVKEINSQFPIEGWLYSWYFKLESVGQEENVWIKKMTLVKNTQYFNNKFLIDKIIFKVFTDTSHFLKHKDTINIFNDKSSLIGETIPRLQSFDYTMPQYVSLFLNVDTIDNRDLRTFILDKIDRQNIIKIIDEKNFKALDNPYFITWSIDRELSAKNIDSIMAQKWYYKSSELIKFFIDDIETQEKNKKKKEETLNSSKQWQINLDEKNTILVSPTPYKYNFITQDDILLKWNVNNSNVTKVYVNDYALKWFKQGDEFFHYRLKQDDYQTIKEGKNVYKISFEINGKKLYKDEIIYYFYKDEAKLSQIKESLIHPIKQEITSSFSGTSDIKTATWTDNSTSSKLTQEQEKDLKKIESLDEKFFYNKKQEQFSLKLIYIDSDKNMQLIAENIKMSLNQFWILVNTSAINVSDLNTMLQKWEKDYDIILAWINLGYFDFNIFPYFHSSQIKNAYNFSNYKKLSLDIALEELKSTTLSPEKITELEKKVVEIIKNEAVMKVLYTPILKQLVDKNIKRYEFPTYLKDDSLRIESLKNAYLLEKKIINVKSKWFSDFIKFLFNNLL